MSAESHSLIIRTASITDTFRWRLTSIRTYQGSLDA